MTLLYLILSILGTIAMTTEAGQEPVADIYWNKTNDRFAPSGSHYVLDVNLGDSIQFLCPHYDTEQEDVENLEHYIIYRVPKQYFDTCSIPSYANEAELRAMKIEKLKNCSSPFTSDFYLTLIDQFYALPGIWGGFLYNPGESYYFTSISTGKLSGLHNRQAEESACQKYHMKAEVRVCCTGNATFTCPEGSTPCSNKSSTSESYTTDGPPDPPVDPPSGATPTPAQPPPASTTRATAQPPVKVTWSSIRSQVTTSAAQRSTNQQSGTKGYVGSASAVTLSNTVMLFTAILTICSLNVGYS